VTAVDELKEPDCGNATEETEKDAEVEKSDYIDVMDITMSISGQVGMNVNEFALMN
jgi:hypothetical protein